MDASWSFHATSHVKTVCDGIGGTVKRTVTKENFQSVYQSTQIRNKLEERFCKGKTITGTRSFHSFSPSSTEEIKAKRKSLDPENMYSMEFY
ncbi:hypothetical protein AVEN_143806-1 [Araneus ventricosus]|uniref:Uncharacterized protein n=1 Tax=Araneus ventricosus TaxID=182803 RepID=A0A4Y2IV82_ARAVE|nr:hypothetical protein AVEN_4996-1 [Araneus ventricosus]GBM81464.1 hypothetical protein AVEN_269074-1 [Araneus ventricosus]GBM81475.1 hypothetical protein AVEN_17105-1 [Araneus ventricosus]GBM81570.1 hypothetical protein AVEN_143806-1 [Araneus ventricosus]